MVTADRAANANAMSFMVIGSRLLIALWMIKSYLEWGLGGICEAGVGL